MGLRLAPFALCLCALLPARTVYQKPPQAVLDVLHAPPSPVASVNPGATHLLLMTPLRYPPIAELAQPMLRLAGHRINPANNGPHNPPSYTAFTLVPIAGGTHLPVAVPPEARLSAVRWSPDGSRFAFLNHTPGAIELWTGETANGKIRKVPGAMLNAAHGEPVQWMPDSRTLLVQLVPAGRGAPPAAPRVPEGPNVQESSGRSGPVRTLQDMLGSPHDEDLFDYYAAAQLALADPAGKLTPLGRPAVFLSSEPAPDGRHILVNRIRRPYSYLHSSYSFPREVEVWNLSGEAVYKVASLPLQDRVPIDGVPVGPRQVQWRAGAPATLVWVEALDGGNPKEKAPHRDRVLSLEAPFSGQPAEMLRLEHRFAGLEFTETGGLALVRDYDRDRRWSRTLLLDTQAPSPAPKLVWSRSVQDRYGHPGTPLQRVVAGGQRAIRLHGGAIFLAGEGATPQGERPFLDRFNLDTRKSERLFRSEADCYEQFVALLDDAGTSFLTMRESLTEPPNFYVRKAGSAERRALTRFTDPAPQLRAIRKELVTYKRKDGVDLSFTLYLPPGYRPGTRLPAVVWAYPREFTGADTAGQVTGSPVRFTRFAGTSHLFFLLAGYAVLDDASMPVVGDPETVNNTYVEQIVMSAEAAIHKADAMGVIDPRRVGVGGHSYGAFMTANLLAHCDLFRAGIARSGAYNRTLTPFGFQSERRTLWEAPEIYLRMSPFLVAHKIKEPLLLIHGEADNNAGTFPLQSERMYQAVRGNGGTVRLVMLPHESHGYLARESIEHTLHEMIAWFDDHVKGN